MIAEVGLQERDGELGIAHLDDAGGRRDGGSVAQQCRVANLLAVDAHKVLAPIPTAENEVGVALLLRLRVAAAEKRREGAAFRAFRNKRRAVDVQEAVVIQPLGGEAGGGRHWRRRGAADGGRRRVGGGRDAQRGTCIPSQQRARKNCHHRGGGFYVG